jgi:hypothetical protein
MRLLSLIFLFFCLYAFSSENFLETKTYEDVYLKEIGLTAGDHVIVSVLGVPENYVLDLQNIKLEQGKIIKVLKDKGEYKIILTFYSPGKHLIPSFRFYDSTNPSKEYFSKQQEVEFKELPKEIKESEEIKKIINNDLANSNEKLADDMGDKEMDSKKISLYHPEQVKIPFWVKLILSFITALLVGCLVYIIRKKLSKKTYVLSNEKLLNPIEEFEEAFKKLNQKNYLESNKLKKHFYELSDNVKKFLGKAYLFESEDKTTEELLKAMKEVGVNEDLISSWQELYKKMDLIKFADFRPSQNEVSSLTKEVYDCVYKSWIVSPVKKQIDLEEIQKSKLENNKK